MAHEERLKGSTEINQGLLLLREEEWRKMENNEGQLLLTGEDWLKRTNKEGTRGSRESRAREVNHRIRDKSRVRCLNFQAYWYFVAECRKP